MSQTIVNAAPMAILRGINDKSIRALLPAPEEIPTHLPKVYIYAEQGPLDPQLVVGNSRVMTYGEKSFQTREKWNTHATELSNLLNARGNAQMIQRVVPDDIGPKASLRVYADVLQTNVKTYERNADGSIKYHPDTNEPIEKGTIKGHKVKFVVVPVLPDEETGEDLFGRGVMIAGDMLNEEGDVQSERYPLFDVRVSHLGAYGNNIGLRIWAPTESSQTPVDMNVIKQNKVYPYRISVMKRKSESEMPKVFSTLHGEQSTEFTFKRDVIKKATDADISIEKVFLDSYRVLNTPGYVDQWGPFDELHIYHDQLEYLLTRFMQAELAVSSDHTDFTDADIEHPHLFNFISGMNSNGVGYQSYEIVKSSTNGSVFTENSTIYASGGSDGTMNEELFAKLVAREIAEYANPLSYLQDISKYPESIFYDSGFPLETKLELTKFIALRKDTAVVLSTHDVLSPVKTASEESSIALSLKAALQMYPESEYFGTPVCRGVIVGRCGNFTGSKYPRKLPLTFELASKAARYMGAGTGIWRGEYAFDRAPGSIVENFTNINVSFTPAIVRNRDWDNGLVWVQTYSRQSVFFPAIQTVYDNDTSVLNSFFTMMACVELEKVCKRAWKAYSGSSDLTNSQLIYRINTFIGEAVAGRFDNRFVIQADTVITGADERRGYSWTTTVRIYAPNMKTVGTFIIEANRMDDLE